ARIAGGVAQVAARLAAVVGPDDDREALHGAGLLGARDRAAQAHEREQESGEPPHGFSHGSELSSLRRRTELCCQGCGRSSSRCRAASGRDASRCAASSTTATSIGALEVTRKNRSKPGAASSS